MGADALPRLQVADRAVGALSGVTDLNSDLVYQIGALDAFARSAESRVSYVKPHGALYNAVVDHPGQADALVAAVTDYDDSLPILGLPGSESLRRAAKGGLSGVTEAFADRAYTPEGTLVSRRRTGAVLLDADEIAQRCVAMAQG